MVSPRENVDETPESVRFESELDPNEKVDAVAEGFGGSGSTALVGAPKENEADGFAEAVPLFAAAPNLNDAVVSSAAVVDGVSSGAMLVEPASFGCDPDPWELRVVAAGQEDAAT